MKILSISSDRKVFEPGSAVRARLLQYGRLVDEINVIVFANRSASFRTESFPPNIFLYPTNSLGKFSHIIFAIFCALKLKRRGVTVDVVTTQDPFETGLAGYIIARIFHARLHIQIHTDVMSAYFGDESLLNRVRVAVAKFLLPRADAVRVVSERIKKSIRNFVREGVSITVLPIFVETKNEHTQSAVDLKKKYSQFNKIVLVASRLAREKNIESVVEAMKVVLVAQPKAGLVIVGDGPEEERLNDLVAKLGLEKSVVFEGWQDDLSGYYKSADIFVLSSNYEGYGMTAVEALSAELPVVMTDVGCAGEIIKDRQNGLIVPVGALQALAEAIEQVLGRKVKLEAKTPILPTKEEYLAEYKKSWEDALL